MNLHEISHTQFQSFINGAVQAFIDGQERKGKPVDTATKPYVRAAVVEIMLLDLLTGMQDLDRLRQRVLGQD